MLVMPEKTRVHKSRISYRVKLGLFSDEIFRRHIKIGVIETKEMSQQMHMPQTSSVYQIFSFLQLHPFFRVHDVLD